MARYRLYYHFVWATKDRLPLLRGAVREAPGADKKCDRIFGR